MLLLKYLDWVILESLRIYPPGAMYNTIINIVSFGIIHLYITLHRVGRYCQKTCSIEGVTVVEDSQVMIPVYTLHHSPEHWEDPEQFLPER